MALKRTPEEIMARMKEVEPNDPFGFQLTDLLCMLPFESAQPLMKEGTTAAEWVEIQDTDPIVKAKEYMVFAWDKANNGRGLSSMRSIEHLKAWLWAAGLPAESLEHFERYTHYGKRQLVLASELLGVDWAILDDGRWANDETGPGESRSFITTEISVARTMANDLRHYLEA
jgi:hypothetical protein